MANGAQFSSQRPYQWNDHSGVEKASFFSPIDLIKITLFALGIITLAIGIAIAFQVPGLNYFGATPGYVVIPVSLILTLGTLVWICLSTFFRVKNYFFKPTNTSLLIDNSGSKTFEQSSKTHLGVNKTEVTPYISLNTLLVDNTYACIRAKLMEKLVIKNLKERLNENFGSQSIKINFPTTDAVINNMQSPLDTPLLNMALLIFMSDKEILSIPSSEVEYYDDHQKDILSLRLQKYQRHQRNCEYYQDNRLSGLLSLTAEKIQYISSDMYIFLSLNQIEDYLSKWESSQIEAWPQDAQDVISKTVIPSREHFPFISDWGIYLVNHLSMKNLQKCIPFLSPTHIKLLVTQRFHEIDFENITPNQVEHLLSSEETKLVSQIQKMSPIILNQLIPKMNFFHLECLLKTKHIHNKSLNLSTLSEAQVQALFPCDYTQQEEAYVRSLENLPIHIVNQLISKMNDKQLALLPDKNLKNKKLDLSNLTSEKLKQMFPETFFRATKRRVQLLSPTNFGYLPNELQNRIK